MEKIFRLEVATVAGGEHPDESTHNSKKWHVVATGTAENLLYGLQDYLNRWDDEHPMDRSALGIGISNKITDYWHRIVEQVED